IDFCDEVKPNPTVTSGHRARIMHVAQHTSRLEPRARRLNLAALPGKVGRVDQDGRSAAVRVAITMKRDAVSARELDANAILFERHSVVTGRGAFGVVRKARPVTF